MLYGLAELAKATGIDRRVLSVWYGRGKLPPPTQALKSGPVWDAQAIEPWIKEVRDARKA